MATFGYSTTPTTPNGGSTGGYPLLDLPGYTGAAGTGVSMSAYISNTHASTDEHAEFALYWLNGSTYTLVASTSAVTIPHNTGGAWYTSNFISPPTLTAQTYYLCMNCDFAEVNFWWAANAGHTSYYTTMTYDTWASFTTVSPLSSSEEFGIYVTYTPATALVRNFVINI
jgi:hypothetical protein